jgi:hypothetical protein
MLRKHGETKNAKGVLRLDIISRRSGPRPEDERAKRHLQQNWATIEKLADTLSGGQYSATKVKKAEPTAQGKIIMDQAPRRSADAPAPYLRISVNGRVVIADASSGLQLHFVGQLKRVDGEVRLIIATQENGFFTPVDPEIFALIADLANRPVNRTYTEDDLAADLKARLKID